jgi:hypothetical protein
MSMELGWTRREAWLGMKGAWKIEFPLLTLLQEIIKLEGVERGQ